MRIASFLCGFRRQATGNTKKRQNGKRHGFLQSPGHFICFSCVSNEHVPMVQCFLETWIEQGVCGSWERDFGILTALGAVACKICFGVLRVDLYLPLSLRRANAGCTGTPSWRHVIRDVRCCTIGTQAVGSRNARLAAMDASGSNKNTHSVASQRRWS